MRITVTLADDWKSNLPILCDDYWYNETSKCFHFRNSMGPMSSGMKTICIIPRDRIFTMWVNDDE